MMILRIPSLITTLTIQTSKCIMVLRIATQHNYAQYDDTQNNNTYNDTQHTTTQGYNGYCTQHNDVRNNETQIRIMTHIIMTLSIQPLKDTMDTTLRIMAFRIM
jgi:hypothetical protein